VIPRTRVSAAQETKGAVNEDCAGQVGPEDVSWNPCRHGYDDRPFLRKSRSEAGVEKMIDTKDGNGNGNDKAGNRN
jgi:hypothetical protein